MPNRDTDPQDPIEDDNLIGTGDDAEEADEEDDEEDEDDDILDEEGDEDDLEDEDEDEDAEDEDEGPTASARAVTGEVGSEGGSPGEAVERTSTRAGLGRGSEATQTWEGGRGRTRERRDQEDGLVKRAP
jgi:ribonuclease E